MKLWALLAAFLAACGGGNMEGKKLKNGWVEFSGKNTTYLRFSQTKNTFWVNLESELALVRFDFEKPTLDYRVFNFRYKDGSAFKFNNGKTSLSSPDLKRFAFLQGRGFDIFIDGGLGPPKFSMIDLKYSFGDNWIYTDSAYQKAIIPLEMAADFEKFGINPGPNIFFRFDLETGSHDSVVLESYARAWLLPDQILLAYPEVNEKRASRWAALDFNLREINTPLVSFFNRHADSLGPVFVVESSKMGWALIQKELENIDTHIFLISWIGDQKAWPLYYKGAEPLNLSGPSSRQLAISPSGDLFVAVAWNPNVPNIDGKESRIQSVYLGKVEFLEGKPVPKLKHLGDFPEVLVEDPVVWFPGSNGFALASDPTSGPSRIWVYSLDENPVDWSKETVAFRIPAK